MTSSEVIGIDQVTLDAKIREMANEDGVEFILGIPGVWSLVYEATINEAIRAIEYSMDEDAMEEEPKPCPDCNDIQVVANKSDAGWVTCPTCDLDICPDCKDTGVIKDANGTESICNSGYRHES